MNFLKKHKDFFGILIFVHIFLFLSFYLTSEGIMGRTFYLQMRRYVPCALAVALAVSFWKKAGYSLKNLLPQAIVGILWVLVYPVCYWVTYHSNTNFIDNHFDQAFGAYFFACIVFLRLLLLKKFGNSNLLNVFWGVWHTFFLLIPAAQILYFINYHSPITEAASMALLQTNKNEATEYVMQNFGHAGILGIVAFFILSIILFSKLNSISSTITEYAFKNWKEKYSVIAAILVVVTGSYCGKIFMETGVLQTYVFAKDYFDRANEFNKYHDSNFANLVVNPSQPQFSKPSTIIMVIGESVGKDFMSAYHKTKNDTTPWLREMNEQNKIILFKHAYTSWGQTVPSLERALTEKNQYNDKEFNQSLTIIDIAKKAGYTTYWFSNQGSIGDADTPITLVAKTADYSEWICDSLANTDKLKYDGDLLDYLKKVDPNKNNFVVLHGMGSHEDFINRYPPEFTRFGEKNKFDMVLNYDNSLAYTDELLKNVYNYASENLNLQAMIYFSDHGGDPNHKRHPDKTGFKALRIPLVLYVSDEYKKLYADSVKMFVNHKNKYFSNDLMYEFVCEVLQIESNSYDESASLLNDKYRFDENTLTTNLGKIKLVEDRIVNYE